MLVCSRSNPEITKSTVKCFSLAMSAQISKSKRKKKKSYHALFFSYMIYMCSSENKIPVIRNIFKYINY